MGVEFETKMSGKNDEYGNGVTRDCQLGKGRYDLISPFALDRLAKVYERGGINRGDRNWEGGIPYSRLLCSAMRHTFQYLRGWRDEDHLAQACWNLFAIMHFEALRPDLDDLPRYEEGTDAE